MHLIMNIYFEIRAMKSSSKKDNASRPRSNEEKTVEIEVPVDKDKPLNTERLSTHTKYVYCRA